MKTFNAWLVVGFFSVSDVFLLIGPSQLLGWLLRWWAEDVMKTDTNTPGFNMILFFLGITVTLLCCRPWNRYWVQGVTEGPRKRALKVIKDSKD